LDGFGEGEALGLAAEEGVIITPPSRRAAAQAAMAVREKNDAADGVNFCII